MPILLDRFKEAIVQKRLGNILAEIIKQSKVEFSYEDDYDISNYEDIETLE